MVILRDLVGSLSSLLAEIPAVAASMRSSHSRRGLSTRS